MLLLALALEISMSFVSLCVRLHAVAEGETKWVGWDVVQGNQESLISLEKSS